MISYKNGDFCKVDCLCDFSGFQITMVPSPWNSTVSFIVLILCALELVHVGPNWFGGKSHGKCQMLFLFDVPHKNSMNINPLSHPHTKISTRSRKIMSVRRSAHLLLGHHASRQELKSWKKQRILRGFDLFLPHVYSSYCFIINKFPFYRIPLYPLYTTLYPNFYCYLFL